jgi:hypothetical protein
MLQPRTGIDDDLTGGTQSQQERRMRVSENYLKNEIVLVTAVSPNAFEQALGMVRLTISLNGLPPGSFPLLISTWC